MKPTVGSLFTGIGGFDLGLERAGWQVKWQVEKEPFRQKVLRRHWPDVELRSDIETDTDGLRRVDLICGGFPCQDLSVAGARAGLAGSRSSLFFRFAALLETLRPRWCLIENVPGLLSSQNGRDFKLVLATLGDIGYWWSYRILDSQYFGVAQRRRRVYIVGHLGAPCPPEILFEPESLGGDTAPSRTAEAQVAGTLGGGSGKRGWAEDLDRSGAFVPERTYPLVSGGNVVVGPAPDADGVRETSGIPGRLDASTPDGHRYAALGDAVTVPVIEWIGRRIMRAHLATK